MRSPQSNLAASSSGQPPSVPLDALELNSANVWQQRHSPDSSSPPNPPGPSGTAVTALRLRQLLTAAPRPRHGYKQRDEKFELVSAPPRVSWAVSPDDIPGHLKWKPAENSIRTKIAVIIPTANENKADAIFSVFYYWVKLRVPEASVTRLKIRTEATMGEQPYNRVGKQAALVRIHQAVGAALAEKLIEPDTHTVFCITIENFFVESNFLPPDRKDKDPVDYPGLIVYHANLGTAVSGFGVGVSVPATYLQLARERGLLDGDSDKGSVTVGKVLAERLGVSDASWHEELVRSPEADRFLVHRRAMIALLRAECKDWLGTIAGEQQPGRPLPATPATPWRALMDAGKGVRKVPSLPNFRGPGSSLPGEAPGAGAGPSPRSSPQDAGDGLECAVDDFGRPRAPLSLIDRPGRYGKDVSRGSPGEARGPASYSGASPVGEGDRCKEPSGVAPRPRAATAPPRPSSAQRPRSPAPTTLREYGARASGLRESRGRPTVPMAAPGHARQGSGSGSSPAKRRRKS